MEKDDTPVQCRFVRYKMKRFYNGDEDEDFQFGNEDVFEPEGFEPEGFVPEGDEETFAAFMGKGDVFSVIQLDLNQIELNQQLLGHAISLAEKSFWWKFKNNDKKIKEIQKIYNKLMIVTDGHANKKG